MVVLPGLPARALPIFTVPPLRWLAVPIVDIMDTHKDKLSKQHNGEVLFVDAPPADIIAEYACERGMYREEERQDQLLLKLRDIKKRRALQIESDMCQYFDKKSHPQVPEQLPNGQKHFAVWSEDGIHPNDDGYAFWGRYIGHAIVEEWKRKRDEIGIAIV
jgi:lysophospholipase L1-like esterase